MGFQIPSTSGLKVYVFHITVIYLFIAKEKYCLEYIN